MCSGQGIEGHINEVRYPGDNHRKRKQVRLQLVILPKSKKQS
ncbi:hypothetical protein C943_04270 [Mariniradius saccharolyticus AK6]|uniref:Uncharacterized protein n=1 Tax=Mariniradius saccharolyticus AK6 TaxID=1239962 RepID=M7Y9V7_9BACT|nr:hypothetical protein C943_04270 [Mariniradius saccharolyticus AK6]